MKIPKMAKIVYRQMPAPRELPQQIPAPGQKLGCKSPRVGANFWCKSSGVSGGEGGWLWQKLTAAYLAGDGVDLDLDFGF